MSYNPNRCVCGKTIFNSLEDAEAYAAKQFKLTSHELNVYACPSNFKRWHLTSANTIKSTQLVLGECQQKNLLILKFPDIQYLLVSPDRYLSKNLHECLTTLWAPANDTRATSIWPIARKKKGAEHWSCEDPWVALEIEKHKHRHIEMLSDLKHIYFERKELHRILNLRRDDTYRAYKMVTQKQVRELLKLRDIDVIQSKVEEPIVVQHTTKQQKIKEERKAIVTRKFITLSEKGIDLWDELISLMPPGQTIGRIVERYIEQEVMNRRILQSIFKK